MQYFHLAIQAAKAYIEYQKTHTSSLHPLTTDPRRQNILAPTLLPLRICYSITIRNQRPTARHI